ncbi:MAG: hypothetical protein ACK5GN_07815 [Pseudomonadota bacterium]|jgi:hypothetical protein
MTSVSLLSIFVLYPLTLLGDGCILIAIALAATVGGRPIVWGAAFAFFHALYGIIGILVADEIAGYSETLGHAFILVGSFILLKHFMHHSLHHQAGGDCSCESHATPSVSTRAIISTASAFSLHSLASGAIVRGMAAGITTPVLIGVLLALSLLIGTLIAVIVLIGDMERMPILRTLDKLPGIVAAVLTGLCCFSAYHLIHDLVKLNSLLQGIALVASLGISGALGWRIHQHRARTSSGLTTSGPTAAGDVVTRIGGGKK